MEVHEEPKRTRTSHFVLRLNDHERAALDRVATQLNLPSASETMRYLIRRADEESRGTRSPIGVSSKKTGGKR